MMPPCHRAPDECQGVGDAFGDGDAELGQESPDHVDELGALSDEEITRPMQRQRGLLLDRLERSAQAAPPDRPVTQTPS
jgi:hypothetical protein